MSDLISRQAAIDAMWKALYAYEDLTEKQFMEHEELELGDWFKHRIFVQRMHEECMKAVNSLPSAKPEIIACGEGELSAEPKTGECSGCKCLGSYESDFPCVNCVRITKDYYCGARMRGEEE